MTRRRHAPANVEAKPTAGEVGSVGRASAKGRRGRRRVLVAGMIVGYLAVIGVVAAAVFVAALPGVGNAPSRVQAILREHGGRPVGSPPPSRVARSVVAVEDQRFYAHHGVDPQSVVRVAWAWLRTRGSTDQGGATLTQQLAKRLHTGRRAGLLDELEQVGLALKLERRYSKTEILRMYLDAAYFGDGHWGLLQASEGYFGKPPERLDWGGEPAGRTGAGALRRRPDGAPGSGGAAPAARPGPADRDRGAEPRRSVRRQPAVRRGGAAAGVHDGPGKLG